MAEMKHVTLVGGLDVGNGYTKGKIMGVGSGVEDVVDMPSASQSDGRGRPKLTVDSSAMAKTVGDDFFNAIDAQIKAPKVPSEARQLFGRASFSGGNGRFHEFTTDTTVPKADQALYGSIVTAVFAAKALKEFFDENGQDAVLEEGSVVHAKVYAAFALPITEYMQKKDAFALRFMDEVHSATVHNFDRKVTVQVEFVSVRVAPEGASAQFAIRSEGELFIDYMMQKNAALGIKPPEDVTAEYLAAASNTIGIDVGEGTVNFPVFAEDREGAPRFDGQASTMMGIGYGRVLENALDEIESSEGFEDLQRTMASRKHLADFVQGYHAKPKAALKARYDKVAELLEKYSEEFAEEVAEAYAKDVAPNATSNEVVFVYGGGASQPWVHAALRKALGRVEKQITVLYIDPGTARNLNRAGLILMARAIAQADGVDLPDPPAKSKKQ